MITPMISKIIRTMIRPMVNPDSAGSFGFNIWQTFNNWG